MVVVKGSSLPARGSLPASRPGMQPPARQPLEAFLQSDPCSLGAGAPETAARAAEHLRAPRAQPSRRERSPRDDPASPHHSPITIALPLSPETPNLLQQGPQAVFQKQLLEIPNLKQTGGLLANPSWLSKSIPTLLSASL